MTSLDVRSNSAVMKRAEQLKRWEESDTNQQPSTPRPQHGSRIKFSAGCVFLAACLASDKDEVLKMLEQGADINTANVDGLTALHQACIDDNLEMVEFLVEHGADINRQDNEGWTPLHATVSCGFVSIARYLVEHGADVAAVNSDGDLAVDLAVDIHHLPMIDFMQKMVTEQQIDCAKARQAEEQQMLSDAKKWLRSDASEVDRPHPKTGHTALHVAAAKGYTKVLSLLLAGRANVDAQDNDGWTALHAAAHWGQKEAAEMLIDAMADIDIRNYSGQTCIDVADHKMVKFLEELRANNKRIKRRPSSQISRISDTIENHLVDKATTKIIHVEVRPDNNKDHINDENCLPAQKTANDTTITTAASTVSDDEAPWRRNNLTRAAGIVRTSLTESTTSKKVPEKGVSNATSISITTTTAAAATPTTNNSNNETSDVILRRTQSFENDEKKSPPITPPTPPKIPKTPSSVNTTPIRRSFVPPVRDEESETQRKAHAKRVRETRRSTQGVTLDEIKSAEELVKKKNSYINNNNSSNSLNNNNRNSSNVDGCANINSNFKLEDASSGNTYPPNNSSIISSAPAVIAAANLSSSIAQRRISTNNNNTAVSSSNANSSSIPMSVRPLSAPPSSSNISPATPSTASSSTTTFSNHNSNYNSNTEDNSSLNSSYQMPKHQRISTSTSTTNLMAETTNVPISTANTVGTLITNNANNANTINSDNNDNDKENDNRNALAAQSVIQRRRKPKRRSTGVVHIDMEDLDPDRQDSANDGEEKESGSEQKHSTRSRLETTSSSTAASSTTATSSTSSTSTSSATYDKKSREKTDNDDNIDYKALWEAVKLENEKLKQQLKKKDDEITQTRTTLERFANTNAKSSLSENEKRERRAMERKLSELEEELKQLQKLKSENERLRAENRALTRVVSKLTTSAQCQLSKSKQ